MDTHLSPLPPLRQGSCVALLAPSGPLPEGRLEAAEQAVRALGLAAKVYPSARARRGYLAGDDARRTELTQNPPSLYLITEAEG